MVAHRSQLLQFIAALLLGAGCTSSQGDFAAGRTNDPCDANYTACKTQVGCILSNQSYTGGKFPGSGKFMVQTDGPSTVEIHFFLIDPSSVGTTTLVTWFESGCSSNFEAPVTGKVFVNQAEANNGEYVFSQQLSSPGDHLITYQSDTTSNFLVKVEVIPTS